jgi:hypothetical protein
MGRQRLFPTPHTCPSEEFIYETTKRESVGDDDILGEAKTYGPENVGSVDSPYLMYCIYKRLFLNTQYDIRNCGDIFKIGDSSVVVDTDGDITIKGKELRGSEGLWELVTCKKLNKQHATSDDLRTYKKILLMDNAH